MVSLTPIISPESLSELHRQYPTPDWEIAKDRKQEWKRSLIENQYRQCAYCEQLLTDKGGKVETDAHIDHLSPQSIFPESRFDITNFVASCNRDAQCGDSKANALLPASLHPYTTQNLQQLLLCDSNGELYSDTLSEADLATVDDTLNLNNPSLKGLRRNLIATIQTAAVSLGRKPNSVPLNTGFRSIYHQQLKAH